MQFLGLLHGLDYWRRDAGSVGDYCLHSLRGPQQRIEVVANDLDGDLGVYAGDHVADKVRQRLLHLDVDAWHFLTERCQQIMDDLIPTVLHRWVHAQNVFAGVNWRRVLVHLRPAGATHEMQNLAIRIGWRLLSLAKLGV